MLLIFFFGGPYASPWKLHVPTFNSIAALSLGFRVQGSMYPYSVLPIEETSEGLVVVLIISIGFRSRVLSNVFKGLREEISQYTGLSSLSSGGSWFELLLFGI